MIDKTINEVYSQLISVVRETYDKAVTTALVKTDYGIVVFNEYVITKIKDGFRVRSRHTFTVVEFTSIRNSLAWIIFEHQRRFKDSKRVAELDSKIASIDVEINIHKRVSRKADTSKYIILLNKIQDEISKKRELEIELGKYLITVKTIAPTILELS
jgi:hypothetical protein